MGLTAVFIGALSLFLAYFQICIALWSTDHETMEHLGGGREEERKLADDMHEGEVKYGYGNVHRIPESTSTEGELLRHEKWFPSCSITVTQYQSAREQTNRNTKARPGPTVLRIVILGKALGEPVCVYHSGFKVSFIARPRRLIPQQIIVSRRKIFG